MITDLAPDRQLAVRYAPDGVRASFATLLALDARLAGIVRATRDPMVGQMRLTWWHDALTRLDIADAPAEPLLQALQRDVVGQGVEGATLATLVDGWDVLLDPLEAEIVAQHGERRGGRLFTLAGRWMPGEPALLAKAGRGWALADLAAHVSQPDIAALARDQARGALNGAFAHRWPASSRPLGALALLQHGAIDMAAPWRSFARLTRFRLTGR